MMTLNKIGDLLLHEFSGGVPARDSGLDRRDLVLKARNYFSLALKPIIFEKKNEGDTSAVSQAIYQYELTLEDNGTEKWVTIPDVYMALPHNKGVHRVYTKGNPYDDYVIQHHPGITSNLPHMKLQNVQYGNIRGLKVIFGKGCTAKKATRIIVEIINPLVDVIGADDPIPAPPEIVAEVISRLRAEFAPLLQVPADMANNQNPNIK